LAIFLVQEPDGQCDSPHLARASDEVTAAFEAAAVMTYRNAIDEVAALTLDVADAAADKGCPAQARLLYRHVVRTFVGTAYAAYRQRAEIGLAEIRGL
jgi:hypothetical protein